eukprot:11989868-Alexandrium_andersonii.AAC.1
MGGSGPKPLLCNQHPAFGEPGKQSACPEAHALFEETLEPEVLIQLLGASKFKPEFQGHSRLR